ncbi:MAG: hypothetical protein ABIT10_00560 [Alteraurantiacibacter sp.]
MMSNGKLAEFCIRAVILVTLLAGCGSQDNLDGDPAIADIQLAAEVDVAPVTAGDPQPDGAQQALEGLFQIRQEQCQSGNQLACNSLAEFSGHSQHLAQWSQACQAGDSGSCASYRDLSEQVFTAYSESAAVMRQGEEAMAQMDAWRAQMNRNAAASMETLRAQGAAGQAAHESRQQAYGAMNDAWQAGQDGGDIAQQQRIDQIYEQERCADGTVVSIHTGC